MFGRKPKPTISHPGQPDMYSYHQGPTYDLGGANNLVLNPLFQLPGIVAFGTGKLPRRNLRIFQGPQLYYSNSVPSVGLGGTPSGALALQGLLQENPQL